MKFKSFLSEGFFGDLIDKGIQKLQGAERASNIKKAREFHNLGSDITELFEKNGFKLVLVEPGEVYWLPYDVLLYTDRSNNRLVSVSDYGKEFFIRCFERNSLSKVSFKTDCDDTNIWSVVDAVCKGKFDELKQEKPEPKRFRSQSSDRNYLRVARTMDWIKTDSETKRILSKYDTLDQIKMLVGSTIPKFVPEESVEKAIKSGLSLGQLYFFVLTRALGYLPERDCLALASRYSV